MKNIFFIPVRKNSKEIPGKNMKKLNGVPLISYVINAIIDSEVEGEIWVATDWRKLSNYIHRTYDNKVTVYHRDPKNAQDTSPTIDVVLEFLSKHRFDKNDNFILLQATSPFTSSQEIQKLNNVLLSRQYDSIISCCRLKRFRWNEDGTSLDYDLIHKPRRQEYKGFLIESGSFYVSKVGRIVETKQLVSGKIHPFEVSSDAFIEIDSLVDWKIAEVVLKHRKSNGLLH